MSQVIDFHTESLDANEASAFCFQSGFYEKGNLIPVAYRLAVVGGSNPICYSNPNYYPVNSRPSGLDCGFTVDPYTGYFNVDLEFATKIFFRILTEYVSSTSEWDDLANYGKMAAADFYSWRNPPFCYDAIAEQQVIFDAFMTVGIDGNPNWWDCTCEENCYSAGS